MNNTIALIKFFKFYCTRFARAVCRPRQTNAIWADLRNKYGGSMENTKPLKEHKLELVNRNLLKITGVERVDAITEKESSFAVLGCELVVTGAQLKAESLSVETGIVVISGLVDNIKYVGKKEKVGFFKRIFK